MLSLLGDVADLQSRLQRWVSNMEWTEERVARLTELWTAGYSARQIAEQLGGVTRNAVIGKANRLGLSKPTKSSITRRRKREEDKSPRLAEPFPEIVDGRLRLTDAPGLGIAPGKAAERFRVEID